MIANVRELRTFTLKKAVEKEKKALSNTCFEECGHMCLALVNKSFVGAGNCWLRFKRLIDEIKQN